MLWILIAVIVIIAAVVNPAVRKVVGGVLGLVVLAGLGLFAYISYQDQIDKREEQAAKQRIPHTNVELSDLRMGLTQFGRLNGRVKNNDGRHTLTRLELRLRIRDCADPEKCDTVGEALESIDIEIPPGQVRALNETTYFRDLGPERPGRTWTYDLVSVSGR
jgi:hypothetical protein